MSSLTMRPCGDFRTSYKQDTTIFETKTIRWVTIFTILALCFAPLVVDGYFITLLIQISYLGIAALGLNILVGYTGQISLGHGAFFGFGAFASAWLNTS
ncbi:MAG: branched-chain amino acid ABC transporter permease, partial [Colwellia sp.]